MVSATAGPSTAIMQEQLIVLERLQQQLNSAKNLTKSLLQPNPLELRKAFEDLQTLSNYVKSSPVQAAFHAAIESELVDPTEIEVHRAALTRVARPTRTRQTQTEKQTTGPLLLPPNDHRLHHQTKEPLTLGTLPEYIRDYNRTSSPPRRVVLHLWKKTRSGGDVLRDRSRPVILRAAIPKLLCVYFTLAPVAGKNVPIRVMSATCMGISEVKPPHAYSDYAVYQQMSQHFARLLSEQNDLSIPFLLDFVSTYEGLFTRECTLCGNLLSRAGRVPPIGRIWRGDGEEKWEPRHGDCCFLD